MIVADTDVLIDYLSGKGEAEQVERFLRAGSLMTTVITRFELLSGAKSSKQRGRLMNLFDAVPSLALDESAADAASAVHIELERTGSVIGMADSLIAGIVLANNGVLLTRNQRHFARVAQLRTV